VLKENAEVRLLAVDFAQYNDRVDSSPAPLLLKAIRRRDDAAQRLRMEITNLKRELEVAKAELALWKSNYESAKARADYLQSDVGKVPTKGNRMNTTPADTNTTPPAVAPGSPAKPRKRSYHYGRRYCLRQALLWLRRAILRNAT
jgi:hypothetical protein